MKIKEFAKRTGVPDTKIRYYSKLGLVQNERKNENNYRDLSEKDALTFYYLQILRAYDVPLALIAPEYEGKRIDEITWTQTRIAELEEEIRLATEKLERFRRLQDDCIRMEHNVGKVQEAGAISSYNIWNLGSDIHLDDQDEEELEALASLFPYSYIGIHVSKESVLNKTENLDVQLGLGILLSEAEKLGLELNREEHMTSTKKGLIFTYQTYDPLVLERNTIKPFLDELSRRGLEVQSDLIGRIYLINRKEDQLLYTVSIGAEI